MTEACIIAERQATLLLKLRGVDGPAVPANTIANLSFVHVAARVGMQSSGATKWIKPRWVVLLNALEPETRQKFSLAHELKHIIDHSRVVELPPTSHPQVHYETELLCDYFAGCLLMPRNWVKKAYADGVQSTAHLAQLFQVSPRAMQVRLSQLGLSNTYGRHGEIDNAYLRSAPASPLGQAA
jgi:Zn-dependent peptidase ImmA (M78 family)